MKEIESILDCLNESNKLRDDAMIHVMEVLLDKDISDVEKENLVEVTKVALETDRTIDKIAYEIIIKRAYGEGKVVAMLKMAIIYTIASIIICLLKMICG